MLFKNALIYRFEEKFTQTDLELEKKFEEFILKPCLSSEMQSVGWISALRQGRNLVVGLERFLFFNVGIEEKLLPKGAVDNAVEKRALSQNIVLDSRAKRKELEELVIAALMPSALTQRKNIFAYIDLEKQWLVIDASSANKASIVTALLRKTLGSLSIVVESPTQSVQSALTYFAKFGIGDTDFEILEDIEIKSLDDGGGQARIKGVPIMATEVQQHIDGGWQVSKLGLQYKARLQFSMGNDFILKRLKLTDLATEEIDGDDDPFLQAQAMALLMAQELRVLISCLLRLISSSDLS